MRSAVDWNVVMRRIPVVASSGDLYKSDVRFVSIYCHEIDFPYGVHIFLAG